MKVDPTTYPGANAPSKDPLAVGGDGSDGNKDRLVKRRNSLCSPLGPVSVAAATENEHMAEFGNCTRRGSGIVIPSYESNISNIEQGQISGASVSIPALIMLPGSDNEKAVQNQSADPLATVSAMTAASAAANSNVLQMFAYTQTFKVLRMARNKGNLTGRVFTAKDVILNAHCCSVFKEFLDNEGTSQTLLFLLEVEEYRRIPSTAFQQSRARKIFTKFVHPLAFLPLPLSDAVREEIETNVPSASPMIFQAAATEVLEYIEKFQFPRFSQTQHLTKVVGILALEHSQISKRQRRLEQISPNRNAYLLP